MALTHMRVVSTPVAYQERAKSFYVDKLGFEVRADVLFEAGQRWVEVAPPGAETSLTLVTWFPTMPPGGISGLVLGCENIEADYAALSARGVPFAGPVEDAPWGRFATFADPDGNGWVLAQ